MSYVSAENVLPKELIETIQQYVSGQSIYIPCKEKKVWGSRTKTKQYYKIRNHEICTKYKNGIPVNTCHYVFPIRKEYTKNHKNN